MFTDISLYQFSDDQLKVFAKADAMYGMSFPYMNEIRAPWPQRPDESRKIPKKFAILLSLPMRFMHR